MNKQVYHFNNDHTDKLWPPSVIIIVLLGKRWNVEKILDYVENVDFPEDNNDKTPLHGAILYNNPEVVELLINR